MIAAVGALAVSMAPATMLAAHADDGSQAPYYLSLGDSLSQGVQPINGHDQVTNRGYVDDLYAIARNQVPGLQLAKLGCPGETTTTMVTGGICPYSANPATNNQLAAAVAFLQTHHVVLVTIDIGGNNVDGCVSLTGVIDSGCVTTGITTAASDLGTHILPGLEAAAPGVRIVGMNYYDAFLGAWAFGAHSLALDSLTGANAFNAALDQVYGLAGVPVADVQKTFQTNNTTMLPLINEPVDVAVVCALTWFCTAADIHANNIGYAVIAGTFAHTIGRLSD